MNLLVEVHVLEADLKQLVVELHALCDLLEIMDVLEGHSNEAQCLNHRLVF